MSSLTVEKPNDTASKNNTASKNDRWIPTAQQVKFLKELFKSGIHTPSIDQICMISTHLKLYGKIENKNVFYWFQNHKARERNKRRKIIQGLTEGASTYLRLREGADTCLRLTEGGLRLTEAANTCFKLTEAADTCLRLTEAGNRKEIKTLQLFPMQTLRESESSSNNTQLHINNEMEHPQLNLRLSLF